MAYRWTWANVNPKRNDEPRNWPRRDFFLNDWFDGEPVAHKIVLFEDWADGWVIVSMEVD